MPAPDWVRRLEWRIKNNFTFTLPVLKTPVKYEQAVIGFSPEKEQRLEELKSKYHLFTWEHVCSKTEWVENLYLLDICDLYVGHIHTEISLDIGSKNWSYLPALTTFTKTPWHGVELDAYRRYWNLSTRKTYAEYMMKICDRCQYFPASLTEIQGQYSFIIWLLPFIKQEPLRYWGLPDRFFEPEKLLHHAWQLLVPGGKLFIVNQGQEETDIQRKLFEIQNIDAQYLGEITSLFNPYKQSRFGWLVTKPA